MDHALEQSRTFFQFAQAERLGRIDEGTQDRQAAFCAEHGAVGRRLLVFLVGLILFFINRFRISEWGEVITFFDWRGAPKTGRQRPAPPAGVCLPIPGIFAPPRCIS
jgi:hypothetical protein